ncbi:hypothetical protein BSL78_24957 [Apostichopus japonicus]|uniref:Protein phosphatase 1 regulatory subunit 7 n=1 Tax=Stichopus japonicus TaxID=307972 RepID=A0A2G8JR06_STIJA|nr:hypothetical protein BSL78_24957 [Apostichopus japonicus]
MSTRNVDSRPTSVPDELPRNSHHIKTVTSAGGRSFGVRSREHVTDKKSDTRLQGHRSAQRARLHKTDYEHGTNKNSRLNRVENTKETKEDNSGQNAVNNVEVDSDSDHEMCEEIESDRVLFIDQNSTVNLDDGAENAGLISPNDVMFSSGASSCDSVFEVDLHSRALAKIENLSKFTKLKTLDLSCNRISEIENLNQNKELKELKLYDNKISEIKGLESLDDLCHLQLQHNRIRKIGDGLKSKKRLKILRLDSNHLEMIESRELAPLSALVSLDVSFNKLQDISSINTLSVLEEFNASHNRLEVVADIGRCKKLKEVNFSSNKLRDISGLGGVQSLLVLSLADNLLTNNSLKALSKLQCLQYLDCSGNKLCNLSTFPDQFPRLEVLLVARNKLDNIEKLLCLQKCSYLTEIILEDNPVCADDSNYQTFKQDLASSLESLEMVDRFHVKKQRGGLGHVPIMRPMSAALALSTRQVENQLQHVQSSLSTFEADLSSSFADLRASMSFLPSEVIKDKTDHSSSDSSVHRGVKSTPPPSITPTTPRPSSRCGSRQRIAEAQAYAAHHF